MVMRIPLPMPGKGTFAMEGMEQGNALRRQALENKIKSIEAQYKPQLNEASIAHTLAQVPYLQAQTQLLNEQIPLYKSKTESDIAYQNALSKQAQQNAIKNAFLLEHPGLMGGQESKTLEALKIMGYIKDDDKQNLNNLNQIVKNNGNVDLSNAPGSQTTSDINHPDTVSVGYQNKNGGIDESAPFNTGNPLVDSILNKPYANAAYQRQMYRSFDWTHTPVLYKNYEIAIGSGMGINPDEFIRMRKDGMSIADIARKYGYDPNNLPKPDFAPTNQNITQLKNRQAALKEMTGIGEFIRNGLSPYARTIPRTGYSAKQIYDAIKNDDPEKQARFLAARGLANEYSAIRMKIANANVGITAMHEVQDKSMTNIQALQSLVTPEVYEKAQKMMDDVIEDAFNEASKVYEVGKRGKPSESPYSVKEKMIKVRNKKTGETKKISESQARKMGLIK